MCIRDSNEAAVHGVHLLGGGGDEQVTVSTLADLGEELARGVKVVGDVDVGGDVYKRQLLGC